MLREFATSDFAKTISFLTICYFKGKFKRFSLEGKAKSNIFAPQFINYL